jgi:hypothetical protein
MVQLHKKLAVKIRLEAQRRFGRDIRLFERSTGLLMSPKSGAMVKPFQDGQADLYGWLRVDGIARHVEIEIKVGKDKLRPEQLAWKNTCEDSGVTYFLIHVPATENIDDAVKRTMDAIERVRRL